MTFPLILIVRNLKPKLEQFLKPKLEPNFSFQNRQLALTHRDVQLVDPEVVVIDAGDALVPAVHLVHRAALPPQLHPLVQGRADPFVSVGLMQASGDLIGKAIKNMEMYIT